MNLSTCFNLQGLKDNIFQLWQVPNVHWIQLWISESATFEYFIEISEKLLNHIFWDGLRLLLLDLQIQRFVMLKKVTVLSHQNIYSSTVKKVSKFWNKKAWWHCLSCYKDMLGICTKEINVKIPDCNMHVLVLLKLIKRFLVTHKRKLCVLCTASFAIVIQKAYSFEQFLCMFREQLLH